MTPRPTLRDLFGGGVQRKTVAAEPDAEQIHASAPRGIATAASPLPHADQIQRAFGHHDISTIRAHVGTAATAAAHAMGANGYAQGEHVVLAESADLRLVAHEAAHVVQQRGGAAPADGVGAAGDAHEQHADQVAARVVAGQSAEALLDRYVRPGTTAPAAASAPVQRDLRTVGDFTKSGDNYNWQPHVTNKTAADGKQAAVVRHGLGTHVVGAKTAKITNSGPAHGARHVTTGEATSVSVAQLGPGVDEGAEPGSWKRPKDLGAAIKLGAGSKMLVPTYHAVPLLPAAYGGSGHAENLVALPPDTESELVTRGHETLDRLVKRAGAWVSYRAEASTETDTVEKTVPAKGKATGGKKMPPVVKQTLIDYTSMVKVVWFELDELGNEVPATRGKFTVRAPKPHNYVDATKTSKLTRIEPQTKGQINRADQAEERDANTAITWRTEIAWGKTHTSGDGRSMEATRLGPDHLQGTQPAHRDAKSKKNLGNYVWDKRTATMMAESGRKYIAGHLLNHHVGGPGNDARNLVAIPADVNSQMETDVEDPIKKLVNNQRAWIYYRADASHTQDSGGNQEWYVDKLKFVWHQLDATTGEPVPGTQGKASYTIDEPSAIKAAGAPKPVKKGKSGKSGKHAAIAPAPGPTFASKVSAPTHGQVQPATATTLPAFSEVILEDAGTLRPILVYQTHLLLVLEQMCLHPRFQHQTHMHLVDHVADVFAQHKPGTAETQAWAEIGKLDDRLAKLDPATRKGAKKLLRRAVKLKAELKIAHDKRDLRTQDLFAATKAQLEQMYDSKFASDAFDHFKTGLLAYTTELAQAEHLVETLIGVAEAAAKGTIQDKDAVIGTANKLRAWLGQPALDKNTDTSKLESDFLNHAEQIGNVSADYPTTPGSPGQFYDEGVLIAKTTSQPLPTSMHEAQSITVRDANHNRKRPREVALHHPASNSLQTLGGLLQTHAAHWPVPGNNKQYDAYSVHTSIYKIANIINLTVYDPDLVGRLLSSYYKENVDGFRQYVKFVAKNPPT